MSNLSDPENERGLVVREETAVTSLARRGLELLGPALSIRSGPMRVLVVDDIPDTLRAVTRIIDATDGMTVVGTATTGIEALEAAARVVPDIVLMDITMPEMGGITAAEILLTRMPRVGIIMMSVLGDADMLRASMRAGASEFLVKPFSADELTGSIRDVAVRRGLAVPP